MLLKYSETTKSCFMKIKERFASELRERHLSYIFSVKRFINVPNP